MRHRNRLPRAPAILVAAAGLAALLPLTVGAARAQSDQAQVLLARARIALGGEARLAAVTTFTLNGSIEIAFAQNRGRTYGHFDIACELPGSFVRTRHIVYGVYGAASRTFDAYGNPYSTNDHQTTLGVDGDRLIYREDPTWDRDPHSRPWIRPSEPTSTQVQKRAELAQDEFLRLTLGMFAAPSGSIAVRFEPVVEDPNAVDVLVDGESTRLTFDPVTHLPSTFGNVTYGDYRDVDGVKVPFRMTMEMGMLREVWEVKDFTFDAPIAPKTFGR